MNVCSRSQRTVLVACTMVATVWAHAPAPAETNMTGRLRDALDRPTKPHPRLFLAQADAAELAQRLDADDLLGRTWTSLRAQADAMLELDPVEREQVGRRLLGVSRTVLKRVSYLALAYRVTGEAPYLERAEREMLAAAAFTDWNPSHFLDVAEMTAALAIGYDWLHEALEPDARRTIRDAIITNGLETSFEHAGWWVTTTNNWSQVCHAGLTLGALAVMDDEPDLAERVIARALEHIHRPMDAYGPNGAYPEGSGYWSYGTSFNVLLIDALRTALGDDFDLSGHERFMASPHYYLHAHGPSTNQFNYSDNSERAAVAPPMYWFARQLEDPSLLWMERRKLERLAAGRQRADGGGDRLLALLLVWAPDGGFEGIDSPEALHYQDRGETPIGIHRTGWDDRATYIGLKAGTPAANHGQMDIGTFVMEAHGVRWAIDLGMQNYHSLESRGLNLWNRAQHSDRWTVFRLNNHSKNTLVVNGEHQRVEGFAPIIAFSDQGPRPHTVIDMTDVYASQLAAARRGAALLPDGAVLIQDEIAAPAGDGEGSAVTSVRWGMLTRAEVAIVAPDRAELRQGGERLGLRVLDGEVELEIYDTESPPADHDAPNPGTRMIGFTITLESTEQRRVAVLLTPGGLGDESPEPTPLEAW